jgi:hypothetical protein
MVESGSELGGHRREAGHKHSSLWLGCVTFENLAIYFFQEGWGLLDEAENCCNSISVTILSVIYSTVGFAFFFFFFLVMCGTGN